VYCFERDSDDVVNEVLDSESHTKKLVERIKVALDKERALLS